MLPRWRLVLFLVLTVTGPVAVLGPGSGVARASIVVALDLPELVRQAEHIAVVDVVSVRSAWDERHERIFSTIELDVVESWKGAPTPSKRITVVQPGGTVDDVSMVVMGLGRFEPGERSLVFLRGSAARAQLVGLAQGKRPMRFESGSRRWLVAPPDMAQLKTVSAPGAAVPGRSVKVPSSPASSLAPAPASARRELSLDDVRAEIERLLQVGKR